MPPRCSVPVTQVRSRTPIALPNGCGAVMVCGLATGRYTPLSASNWSMRSWQMARPRIAVTGTPADLSPERRRQLSGYYRSYYRFVPQSARAKRPKVPVPSAPKCPWIIPSTHRVSVGDIAGRLATLTAMESGRVMLNDQRKQVGRKRRTAGTFRQIGQGLLHLPQQNTIIKDRLIETAGLLSDGEPDVAFQHSILCQTSLPYRDPGPDVRWWHRRQGDAMLEIEAGRAMHPETREWVPLGLPWGAKARLVLVHLNAEAIRTQSPVVDVGDSLTAFVRRLGLDPNGRTIRSIKDQVGALSAALIRMAHVGPGGPCQFDTKVISGFDLWFPKDDRQRVLWPSTVRLSLEYFESLLAHAVPLDERALRALSHSALALDLYAWLAQRLHRIPKPRRQFIPWPAVKDQFGPDYDRLRKFREVFMETLRQVHAVYPAMKIDVTGHGLFLHTSPPPVVKTGIVVKLPA
jgi:Plasmid encoded RepA protein